MRWGAPGRRVASSLGLDPDRSHTVNRRRRLTVLATAAVATTAVAAPAADAAICFKALPGPGGTAWQIQQDGSQDTALQYEGGSNFDEHHGRLTVNGVAYPSIPNDEDACTVTDTSITYPERPIGGGIWLTRRITSIGGRIRRLDTIRNSSAASQWVDVELALRVLGSQVLVESESGDARATSNDHWSVHENAGNSFPFLQWGVGGGDSFDPDVVSLGDGNPSGWEQKAGSMPDADLSYKDISIPSNESIRLLHMTGTTGAQSTSEDAAKDRLTPFTGLTLEDSARVINWGSDPDGDGVGRSDDECPGTKGNQPNGCFTLVAKPADQKPGDTPPGDTPPGETPPANTPPADTPPGPVPPAADTRAPGITITKLGRRAKRSRLTRKGLAPRIACDESCSIQVVVKTRKRGRRKASTVLTTRATPQSAAARTVRLKLKPRHLRRLAKRRLTILVTATDTAGNRRSVTRTLNVGR